MLAFAAVALSLVFALSGALSCARADETRLYISQFQSGSLAAVDPASGAVVNQLPVKDDAGITAIAAGPTGRLFVLDGGSASRLRLVDAAGLRVDKEVNFKDRLLNFSDQDLLYAALDGRWLLVRTYQYADALNQTRIFDVGKADFTATTLPDTGCSRPVLSSARDGTIFVLCPGRMVTLQLNALAEAVTKSHTPLPFTEILAATAAPDGKDVYIVGIAAPAEWKIARWQQRGGTVIVSGAAALLGLSEQSLSTDRQIWCGMSRDGQRLVFVRDTHILIFDRDLKPTNRYELPSAARAVAMDPTADAVLTLHWTESDSVPRSVRTSLSSGASAIVATRLFFGSAPVSFHAGAVGGSR